MGVKQSNNLEGIIVIALAITFTLFLLPLNSIPFVGADTNVSVTSGNASIIGNGTNHSGLTGLILFNTTFINSTDILVFGVGQTDVNVTWLFNKSDTGADIPTLLVSNSSQCAHTETAGAATVIACWAYLTINSTHDGQWNITAAIYNATDNLNATANGALVRFDSTRPTVQAANISGPSTGTNLTGTIILNVSVIDAGIGLDKVFFNITNSTGAQNTTISATSSGTNQWNATLDTTIYLDGTYNITIWANDTTGNSNSTALVHTVVFDNTDPTGTFSCTPSPTTEGNTVTCTCGAEADTTSGVETKTVSTPSTTTTGTHTESCTITDYAGNSLALSASFTVEAVGTTTSSGGGGGSGSSVSPGAGDDTLLSPEDEEEKSILDKAADAIDAKVGQSETADEKSNTAAIIVSVIVIIVVAVGIAYFIRRKNSLKVIKKK